jgi:hypothetical protein
MEIFNMLKKFLSQFTNKKIHKGYGVTTDSKVVLPKEITEQEAIRPLSPSSIKYKLNDELGMFELVGLVRNGTAVSYRLRHVMTGDIIDIGNKVFKLFFKNVEKC